jgi:copper chaperone
MAIEFELPDMSCQHCVQAIIEAVRRIDPEAALTTDLPAHRVHIESSRSAAADFAAALSEAGYPPR